MIFKTSKGSGGFGDRIVGLISCIALSEAIHEELYINWSSPNIKKIFDYKSTKKETSNLFQFIDKEDFLSFIKSVNLNSFKNATIVSNLNFVDKIFINQNIPRNSYLDYILNIYKNLFVNLLKPKKILLKRINANLEKFHGKTIGIQVRMGDVYIGVGKYKNFDFSLIKNIFELINNDTNFESIFLTSDNIEIINIASDYFKNKKIIYDSTKITHIDRMNTNTSELLKVVSDLITLSKTNFRYITTNSNFGRISNLISNNPSNFKGISSEGLKNVDIVSLTKKGELFC